MKLSFLCALLSLAAQNGLAQDLTPERKVEGNRLDCAREPKVAITVPAALSYIGAERFVL